MDHKVHPMPSHPSAPPSHSRHSSIGTQSTTSSVAIQMPDEHALRKEQERSLMHDSGSDDGLQQQKDFIYKVPQPLPPNHPSVRAERRRQRRGCCCGRSCCCWLGILCSIFAAIVIILGIAALVLYLVLQPKTPDFSVSDASITSFNLSTQPLSASNAIAGASVYLNADVTFNVSAENPNKKIGIFYDAVDVTLFYDDQNIGQGSIPAFYQGHRNTTLLLLHMKGQDVGLTSTVGSTLRTTLSVASNSIFLHARTLAEVRIKVGSWKSRASKFQIDCNVEMSNPTAPNPRLLSKSCSFKVKKFML
ncbi:hypothetical protein L7F22_025741 [Adiantum nelumboides]|nr:hypothetical protein [Adiantum nelumboides]MCO5571990.1 hypothetical protein [Adiantum nelumboides]